MNPSCPICNLRFVNIDELTFHYNAVCKPLDSIELTSIEKCILNNIEHGICIKTTDKEFHLRLTLLMRKLYKIKTGKDLDIGKLRLGVVE